MASGFSKTVSSTVTLSGGATSGNQSGVINVPYRTGIILGVYVERTTGDATDFGFNVYSRKNGSNYYTTESNTYRLHNVSSATQTVYQDGDANFAYLAETAGSDGARLAIAYNIAFSGATGDSTVGYRIRVIALGVN